jgi:hypothetical protein
MTEFWKDIEGYEGLYQISNKGRVKSLGNKHRKSVMILKPTIEYYGYHTVSLCRNQEGKTKKVHRLVAKAFVSGYDDTKEINHKDGNKLNNIPENLEWVTVKENAQHAFRIGLRKNSKADKHPERKISSEDVFCIHGLYLTGLFTQLDIGRMFGISDGHVGMILDGKRWKSIYFKEGLK